MLWSDSPEATNYYRSRVPSWSSFWLLDSTGERVVGTLQYDSALVNELLNLLF